MAAVVAVPRSLERETYCLAGRTLAIEVDDESVAQILRTTYVDARIPNMRTWDHTASLRRLSDGRLHVRFDRRTLAIGEPAPVPLLSAYYATKEVFARFAAAHPGSIAFYGALVAVRNGAVLILGPTTIGKTLFALHLTAHGAAFLGDETALLDLRTARVCALARKPALRDSALAYLPSPEMRSSVSSADTMVDTERGRFWYALAAEHLGGIAPSDRSHRLAAVCVIRERAPMHAVERVDMSRALPAIMQRAYTRPSQLAQLSSLRRAMRSVAFYEVTLADPRDTAAAFLSEVSQCA